MLRRERKAAKKRRVALQRYKTFCMQEDIEDSVQRMKRKKAAMDCSTAAKSTVEGCVYGSNGIPAVSPTDP